MPKPEGKLLLTPDLDDEADLAEAVDDAARSLPLSEGTQNLVSSSTREKAAHSLRAYYTNMSDALRQRKIGRVLGAIRDMALFSARRTLAGSVKGNVTPEIMAEVDKALGLPPIDPTLGADPTTSTYPENPKSVF